MVRDGNNEDGGGGDDALSPTSAENGQIAGGGNGAKKNREQIKPAAQLDPGQYDERNLSESLTRYLGGDTGFCFIALHVGGAVRAQWAFPDTVDVNTKPPPITLPDLQMCNENWANYVCGRVSPWIDVDSGNAAIREISSTELKRELDYAQYLGLRAVIVDLKYIRGNENLARMIGEMYWDAGSTRTTRTYISVPTDPAELQCLQTDNHPASDGSIWKAWTSFRSSPVLDNHAFVLPLLKISADLSDEFIVESQLERWSGENVVGTRIDEQIFIAPTDGSKPCLPQAHECLLRRVLQLCSAVFVSFAAGPVDERVRVRLKTLIAEYLAPLFAEARAEPDYCTEKELAAKASLLPYANAIQVPLQPLAENLDAGTYEIFEEDPYKYVAYREAILNAITDRKQKWVAQQLLIVVLGAGRGPLVTKAIEAVRLFEKNWSMRNVRLQFKIVAVEKNPNAIVTLTYLQRTQWQDDNVEIFEGDMREFRPASEPDIIVSELLGSFSDNELSPECLDGAAHLFGQHTISIPCDYTSYAEPMQSMAVYNAIRELQSPVWHNLHRGRLMTRRDEERHQAYVPIQLHDLTDHLYVVYLKTVHRSSEPQPVFKFAHPRSSGEANTRDTVLRFRLKEDCQVMGFACYFEATLYGDVKLSTLPSSHSPAMVSWFPGVLPLRSVTNLSKDEELSLHISRKVDSTGVWYEWRSTFTLPNGEAVTTEIQNENGRSYYMRL